MSANSVIQQARQKNSNVNALIILSYNKKFRSSFVAFEPLKRVTTEELTPPMRLVPICSTIKQKVCPETLEKQTVKGTPQGKKALEKGCYIRERKLCKKIAKRSGWYCCWHGVSCGRKKNCNLCRSSSPWPFCWR